MSQEKLGEALGLTFQQVQKYEKGTNRISASRLQQISEALDIPLSFLFKGAPLSPMARVNGGFAEGGVQDSYASDFVMTAEGLNLNRAFARIADPKVRKKIVDLVTALSKARRARRSGRCVRLPNAFWRNADETNAIPLNMILGAQSQRAFGFCVRFSRAKRA